MTKEEKQLLFKDLCARLPYGVIIKEEYGDYINVNFYNANIEHLIDRILAGVDKLVLRPMSSMTAEEKSWYESLRNALTYQENGEYDLDDFNELNDFLNRRKLDRYGLIEKGLALPAPKGMYNF